MESCSEQGDCDNHLRLILDQIGEGYFETDLEGNLRCLNPSLARLLEKPLKAATGTSFREHTTDRSGQEIYDLFHRIFQTGEPVQRKKHEIHLADGRIIQAQLSVNLLRNRSGLVTGFCGIVRDESASNLFQKQKEQLRQHLEQALHMEAIGTLAAGIAHDFNNILTSIQGYVSILKLHIDQPHPTYDKLLRLDDLVQNAADLTRQLLGFAGGGKYESGILNIHTLLKRVTLLTLRSRKEIQVKEDFQDDIWMIEADRRQLEQALQGLIVNAGRAMPDGGTLTMKTRNRLLQDQTAALLDLPAGRYIHIAIADTGVGMDEETCKRLFEPFYTTQKMGRGTGLGLAATYGIVRHHDGRILVSSQPGRGSCFEIYLPAPATDRPPDPETAMKVETGTETILLVDDEQSVREIGGEILKELGYTIQTAESGEEALSFVEKNTEVDLIILDLMMPGMSGIEAYRALKNIRPEIPVLLASGFDVDTQPAAGLLKDQDVFIQKPFRLMVLARNLRELLDNRKSET